MKCSFFKKIKMGEVNTCGSPRPTTQLDFNQAMKDFATMFPKMDRDVIEEVLRANQGAVDATIDQLLAMSTDNLNEALRLDLEKSEGEQPPSLPPPDVTKHSADALRVLKNWTPPLVGPLPATFLRVSSPNQTVTSECVEDERIALFLQNEEFLSELRINQDFMSTLDDDLGERGFSHDAEAFKERLRNMGKISRNKFSQLAKVFQRRKKTRSAKGILDHNSGGDALLLSGEPLITDKEEESSATQKG